MKFSRNLKDIERNAFYLADIISSDVEEREDAALLIRKGRAFFPFFYRGGLAFSPSKFIGYRANELEKHLNLRSGRDGKDTNREINRILGFRYVEDDRLHDALEAYCDEIGVELEGHKHRFWPTQSAKRFLEDERSAIDDLDPEPPGNPAPRRKSATGEFFVRDPKVRRKVLDRAQGKCEHCGEFGFRKFDGTYYVESHHIISLAQQGPDTLDNVIALCPNHHREAHFGDGSVQLEAEFMIKLASLRGK